MLPPAFYTTFPAGWGKLAKATAGQLKGSGLKPGMPDILVFSCHKMIANRIYPKIIGIELKVGKGLLSPEQIGMHRRLMAIGIKSYICRSAADVIGTLNLEQIPHREIKISEETTDVEDHHSGYDAGIPVS